jgi:hypothetical protein
VPETTPAAPDGGSTGAVVASIGASRGEVAFHGAVAVDYAGFALRDRAYRPNIRLGSLAGLVTVRPCELVLVTGAQHGRVGCTVVVADRDPGAELDAYEDVEEVTFTSPTGIVSLVGRSDGHPAADLDLGADAGTYRVRYHARGMDEAADADDDVVVDEYLVQIWPAPETPRSRPKVTSVCGRYWAELGDVREEAVTPPVPEGVGSEVSPPGRALVAEALPAAVTSTYWSHLLLRPGDHVRSRRAWLVFRPDGNLVVCDEETRVRWTSGTAGRGVEAVFQIDGSLAVYNGDGDVEWASGTHGYAGNYLAVQDDGNVVVYRADGNALWSTDTDH